LGSATFGEVTIDEFAQTQALGEVIESGDGTKLGDGSFLGRVGLGVGVADGRDEVVSPAEVLLPDDLGLAADAAAFAGLVVGVAAEDLPDNACHMVGHTAQLTEWQ
jgi:hypothetical protein